MRKSECSAGSLRRVLFVEDDPLARFTGRRCLETLGFHVTDVGNCRDSERAWRSGDFDLVVSDYRLPDGFGTGVVETMRAAGYREPVVCVTAEHESLPPEDCTRLGVVAVVAKPLDMDEFRAAALDALSLTDRVLCRARTSGPAAQRVGRFAVVSCPSIVDRRAVSRIERQWGDESWLALRMGRTSRMDRLAADGLAAAAERRRRNGGRLCLVGLSGDSLDTLKQATGGTEIDVVAGEAALASLGRRLSSICERAQVLGCVVTEESP